MEKGQYTDECLHNVMIAVCPESDPSLTMTNANILNLKLVVLAGLCWVRRNGERDRIPRRMNSLWSPPGIVEPFTGWRLKCDSVISSKVMEREEGFKNRGTLRTSSSISPQDTTQGLTVSILQGVPVKPSHTNRQSIQKFQCCLCSVKSQMAAWVNFHITKTSRLIHGILA